MVRKPDALSFGAHFGNSGLNPCFKHPEPSFFRAPQFFFLSTVAQTVEYSASNAKVMGLTAKNVRLLKSVP